MLSEPPGSPISINSKTTSVSKQTNSRKSRAPQTPDSDSEINTSGEVAKGDHVPGKLQNSSSNLFAHATISNVHNSCSLSSSPLIGIKNFPLQNSNSNNLNNLINDDKFQSQQLLSHNQQQQQQQKLPLQILVGNSPKSDRIMSKEKQKFFRLSAFNSERIIKSPTRQISHSMVNPPINNRRPPTPACQLNADEMERNYKKVRNKVLLKKRRKESTGTTSSNNSSSSENDGNLSNSSSGSSSSSEDGNSSSSSDDDEDDDTTSSSECSKKESEIGMFGSFSHRTKDMNQSHGNSGFCSPSTFGTGFNNIFASSFVSGIMKTNEKEWGFAAEAKKVDIFGNTNEKIFGSSASVNDNVTLSTKREKKRPGRKRAEKSKNNQLDALFDGLSHLYAATDINRQKIKEKKSSRNKQNGSSALESASQTNNKALPSLIPHQKQIVLKETRRTYRDYENSLRLNDIKNNHQTDEEFSTINRNSRRSLSDFGDKLPNFAIMSSDDDFSQLSPSKMVKRAIISQKYDQTNCKYMFMSPQNALNGPKNQSNKSELLDFAQLSQNIKNYSSNKHSDTVMGIPGDKSNNNHTTQCRSFTSNSSINTSDYVPPPYNNSKYCGKKHI